METDFTYIAEKATLYEVHECSIVRWTPYMYNVYGGIQCTRALVISLYAASR